MTVIFFCFCFCFFFSCFWCNNVRKPFQSFRFLKDHICFDNPRERTQLWETDRFAAVREIWEIFNSNLSKHVAPSEYLSIDETLYLMRQQIAFRQYNPNKSRRYGLLLKSLNDARFPYTYKAAPYAAKPKAGDGPYYLKSTIDYIKYLVTEMEVDQPITGRTISTNRLYTSIESTNWLLDRGIATVGTLQKGRNGKSYWHSKQRDFLCNLSFWKGKEEHLPGILHRQNKVKRKEKCCCVIDLQTITQQNNWWW